MTPAPGSSAKPSQTLIELFTAHAEGVATDAQIAELERLIASDENLRAQYIACTLIRSALLNPAREPSAERGTRIAEVSAEGVPIYRKGHEPKPKSAISYFKFSIFNLQFQLLAAALLAACGLAAYFLVFNADPSDIEHRPSHTEHPPVATVIDAADGARVFVDDDILRPGDDARAGTYTIEAGTAELQLQSLANVRMFGATQLRIHSPMRASMARGKAVFRCPPSAVGYAVDLPGGFRVIDLGTRFSVAIDEQGRSTVDVIEGSVSIETVDPAPPRRAVLAAGDSVVAHDARFTVRRAAETDTPRNPLGRDTLDLADIVAGGNGDGSADGLGISVIDGKPIDQPGGLVHADPRNARFVRAAHPLVDGVFIPDGIDDDANAAPVTVTSTGLTAVGLPEGGSATWDHIRSGLTDKTTEPTGFDSVIGLHASKGITFDLDAIAAAHDDRAATRLTATAALGHEKGDAVAFVVIDGRVAARVPLVGIAQRELEIDLPPDARFLSLIAVANGLNFEDWAAFGDPRLHLEPADNE